MQAGGAPGVLPPVALLPSTATSPPHAEPTHIPSQRRSRLPGRKGRKPGEAACVERGLGIAAQSRRVPPSFHLALPKRRLLRVNLTQLTKRWPTPSSITAGGGQRRKEKRMGEKRRGVQRRGRGETLKACQSLLIILIAELQLHAKA